MINSSNQKTTKAILTNDGRTMIKQADGSYIMANDKTDWSRLDAMKDSEIDYSDIPELTEDFFKKAIITMPPKKEQLTIRLDNDLLNWLKLQGRGYQTRINTILRAYMLAHSKNHS